MKRSLCILGLALSGLAVGAPAAHAGCPDNLGADWCLQMYRAAHPATQARPRAPEALGGGVGGLASSLALARLATAKYATSLDRAKADGYRIITRMIPYMGYHFLNSKVTGFDVTRPPILVYTHRGRAWQLVALEWVFAKKPAKVPLLGAHYGSFGAACHYVDGTFVFAASQARCAATSPQSGAAFAFWHPQLITLHVWLWYPNPTGLYMGTNPLVAPFNGG